MHEITLRVTHLHGQPIDPDPHPDLLVVSLPKRVTIAGRQLLLSRGWQSVLVHDRAGRPLGKIRTTVTGLHATITCHEATPVSGEPLCTGSDEHALQHIVTANQHAK